MKIAIATWSYDEHQGISRCVVELSSRLARTHDVHVFTADIATQPRPGVHVHKVPLRFPQVHLNDYDFCFRVGCMLRRESWDLVHAHFPVWCPTDVYTCHGLARMALRSFRNFPTAARVDVSSLRMLRWHAQVPLHAWAVRQHRPLLTAVSHKVAVELAEESRRPIEQVTVVANGVDLERFSPDTATCLRRDARVRLGLADDRFVLLWVGNSLRHKGIRYAIDTLTQLPPSAMLLAVGADSPAKVPELATQIAVLQAQGRLRFLGTDTQIEQYYAAADALLFPSLYESFGLVVLEAMAMGLPVVTARTVGLADEALKDGVNGMVVHQPWQTTAMAERVLRLMTDEGLRGDIVSAGRRTAQKYTWDSYCDAYERLYTGALQARHLNRDRAHAT